jgi:hypothetical protein
MVDRAPGRVALAAIVELGFLLRNFISFSICLAGANAVLYIRCAADFDQVVDGIGSLFMQL